MPGAGVVTPPWKVSGTGRASAVLTWSVLVTVAVPVGRVVGVVVRLPVTGSPMTRLPWPGGAGIGCPTGRSRVTVIVSMPSAKPVVSSVPEVDRDQRGRHVERHGDRRGGEEHVAVGVGDGVRGQDRCGSFTAAWICAETSTWPPGLGERRVGGDAGDEDRLVAERELARRARVISGAPSAVAVTVKLAGTSVVPDSVRSA